MIRLFQRYDSIVSADRATMLRDAPPDALNLPFAAVLARKRILANSARSVILSRHLYKTERKALGAKHSIKRGLRPGGYFSRTLLQVEPAVLDRFVLVV